LRVSAQFTRRLQDSACDAVFQESDVEVDKETDLEAGELQVAEELGLVDGNDLVDGLQLNGDGVFDNEVEAVATLDVLAFVDDRKFHLAAVGQAAECELMRETGFIRGFEKAGAEGVVDLNGGTDDGFGELLVREVRHGSSPERVHHKAHRVTQRMRVCPEFR
jgi:hypothetical protein